MKWQHSLTNWRKQRNLTGPQSGYLDMMSEELEEGVVALAAKDWHEQVDSVCDQLVLTTNCIEQTLPLVPDYSRTYWADGITKSQLLAQFTGDEPFEDLQALYGIVDLLTAELTSLGVVPDLAMKQALKHISARIIDPDKQADWDAGKLNKWPKHPNQPADTLYEPDYNLCKVRPT